MVNIEINCVNFTSQQARSLQHSEYVHEFHLKSLNYRNILWAISSNNVITSDLLVTSNKDDTPTDLSTKIIPVIN
uniref:Uncharacterized protein n=1 Tax=Rhizophora mucronata TaxID=61149 RepID=A0A2P2QQC4_RHIMU